MTDQIQQVDWAKKIREDQALATNTRRAAADGIRQSMIRDWVQPELETPLFGEVGVTTEEFRMASGDMNEIILWVGRVKVTVKVTATVED